MIESVEEGILALDIDGLITIFNPSSQTLFGISERQAVGKSFATVIHRQENLLALVESSWQSGRTISRHEDISIWGTGGQEIPVSVSVSPLFSAEGVREGTVVILRDLTRVRDLEQAVGRSERLSVLGSIAAGLAHEIKNPLGGIKGAAQLMAMEVGADSPVQEYLDVMLREADRVNATIEELMDLTNPRKPRMDKVNLAKILREIILLQEGQGKERNVTFQLKLDPSIPPIDADELLLIRLFRNLIINGAEAMPDGGVVKIETRISSDYQIMASGQKPTPMVKVVVSDTGIGITLEEQERIFTPFFTTKNEGHGLGLAICQKIVSEHNGLIKINSAAGEGTTFSVSLPLFQRGTDDEC